MWLFYRYRDTPWFRYGGNTASGVYISLIRRWIPRRNASEMLHFSAILITAILLVIIFRNKRYGLLCRNDSSFCCYFYNSINWIQKQTFYDKRATFSWKRNIFIEKCILKMMAILHFPTFSTCSFGAFMTMLVMLILGHINNEHYLENLD